MDNYRVKKAIDDARHIYEDYFEAKKNVDMFNNIPNYDVQILPKHTHSTCSRCLNYFDHNESNYFKDQGFICNDCLNDQTPTFS